MDLSHPESKRFWQFRRWFVLSNTKLCGSVNNSSEGSQVSPHDYRKWLHPTDSGAFPCLKKIISLCIQQRPWYRAQGWQLRRCCLTAVHKAKGSLGTTPVTSQSLQVLRVQQMMLRGATHSQLTPLTPSLDRSWKSLTQAADRVLSHVFELRLTPTSK